MTAANPRTGADWVFVPLSEAISALVGFVVLVHVARTLGAAAFAAVELSAMIAGVLLVLVRSGVESIAHREAARRPSLIGPISEALLTVKLGLAGACVFTVVGAAWLAGSPSLPVFAVGIILLVPSALSLDVAPRALCEYRTIAVIQTLRSVGLAIAVLLLVREPGNSVAAVGCAALAESLSALAWLIVHVHRFGFPSRLHVRVARVLLGRGTIASLGRFGRVFLYAADILFLGWMLSPEEIGPYAAARRLAFAVAAIGVAVPTAFAPVIATAWAEGAARASEALGGTVRRVLGLSIPASLGLSLTARGWMSALFGTSFEAGSISLALFAARLPVLMLAATTGAALVAVRRESEGLRIVAVTVLFAVVALPIAILRFGLTGAASTMIVAEGLAAGLGWAELHRMGAAPRVPPLAVADLCGTGAMVGVVIVGAGLPVALLSASGAAGFFAVRVLASPRRPRIAEVSR